MTDAYRDAEAILDQAPVSDGALDLDTVGLKRPGATWTYMVTDDHFGSEWERIGKFLAKEIRLPSRPIR